MPNQTPDKYHFYEKQEIFPSRILALSKLYILSYYAMPLNVLCDLLCLWHTIVAHKYLLTNFDYAVLLSTQLFT